MERPMKKPKLPKTDSIQKLAEFWDSHDLTDFEDELEEVTELVFARGSAIKVPLESREVEAVEQLARAKGVSREELIRTWVLQKIGGRGDARPAKR
jgi:predicted DNA binding CopG/RHH family protein